LFLNSLPAQVDLDATVKPYPLATSKPRDKLPSLGQVHLYLVYQWLVDGKRASAILDALVEVYRVWHHGDHSVSNRTRDNLSESTTPWARSYE